MCKSPWAVERRGNGQLDHLPRAHLFHDRRCHVSANHPDIVEIPHWVRTAPYAVLWAEWSTDHDRFVGCPNRLPKRLRFSIPAQTRVEAFGHVARIMERAKCGLASWRIVTVKRLSIDVLDEMLRIGRRMGSVRSVSCLMVADAIEVEEDLVEEIAKAFVRGGA